MKKLITTFKSFPNLKPKTRNLKPNRRELGFSMVIWILLVVFIFSVLMVTGSFSLEGTKATYRTLTPTPIGGKAPPADSGPATPGAWTIEKIEGSCKKLKEPFYYEGSMTAKGIDAGYVTVGTQSTDSTWTVIKTAIFSPPSTDYTFSLSNASGYNTKKWRVQLFTGGILTGGLWSGGTFKATSGDKEATGC